MNLPPLSQSSVELASCPSAYVAVKINGMSGGDSTPSERGTDVHNVMAQYISDCASRQVPANWELFNRLAARSGPVAGPILDGIRDTYEVDWKRVYGTEITMMLDEQFQPTLEISEDHWPKHIPQRNFITPLDYKGGYAAHIGTMDVLLLNEDGTSAKIEDFKTYPAPVDADTYQGTLYPFMLFKHLPTLQTITFELIFVRYVNCRRSVTWRREDMPQMQAAIARARARQRATHENPDDAMALPGKTCTYCALAKNLTCKIADWNEYTIMQPADRLRAVVFYRKMQSLHMPVLKAEAEVNGPVRYADGNGKVTEYGCIPVPSTRYPLDQTTVMVLQRHRSATGEDLMDGRLNISSTSIKPLLKAKKRIGLAEIFEDSIIQAGTKPSFAIRTPEGIEPSYQKDEE